jgi:hypothetical protein
MSALGQKRTRVSGLLVRAARSAILSIAFCQPCLASFKAYAAKALLSVIATNVVVPPPVRKALRRYGVPEFFAPPKRKRGERHHDPDPLVFAVDDAKTGRLGESAGWKLGSRC